MFSGWVVLIHKEHLPCPQYSTCLLYTSVVTEKGKFILNLLPSGILHPEVTCVLGTGMVVDLDHLAEMCIRDRN